MEPDRLLYMYVRKEAVLSSQIEGTQSTLSELLEYESDDGGCGRLERQEGTPAISQDDRSPLQLWAHHGSSGSAVVSHPRLHR